MIRPSERAGWDLAPNAFTAACQRRVLDGHDVIDLAQSNPTTVGLDMAQPAVFHALASEASRRYEPAPRGLRSAREAVAAWYRERGLVVDPSQLLLTASSSEAYGFLLKLLCDPGDTILVPAPSYPLFDQLARLECVTVARYPLMADDGWRIDEIALREAVRPGTRAIFLVSPNNPTGSFLHEEERRCVERVARDHGLALVCDEVFAEYVWRDAPDRVRCAALDAQVPTFSLGGLSKSACLPQMKLGWIVMGGPSVGDAVLRLEMIADTYLSVSAPVQHAAGALLEGAGLAREKLASRIRGNLATLDQVLAGTPVSATAVDAGWYACLRVPSVMTDEQWAVKLVEQDGVVVHPGSFFGFPRAGMLVAGLIAAPEVFQEGMRRLVARARSVAP